MAYASKRGRRPTEYASKSAHVHIINSLSIQAFLSECDMPKRAAEISLAQHRVGSLSAPAYNPIRHIIAIDGGFTEVPVQVEFPSATVAFFQFGALFFHMHDLETLAEQAFIDPADMSKLKQMQRLELILPIRSISLKTETTLTHSVRRAIYDFFRKRMEDGLVTLRWLIFQEYGPTLSQYELASCPHCGGHKIALCRNRITPDFTFECSLCHKDILLTDVFRLHEAIDDDIGASGILGYVTTMLEQMVLVHLIRLLLKTKPSTLGEIFFIKDGPLAFFGQTANMHKPLRSLVNHLATSQNFYLAGLEKSGPFVEHADEIAPLLQPGQFLLLDTDYIYKYITPGHADPSNTYGGTTYYGNKLIFKSRDERVYVVTLPTSHVLTHPTPADFPNLHATLANIEKLRCDMYDDALFPVALVNKLVSLADHPSAHILKKFAVDAMQSAGLSTQN